MRMLGWAVAAGALAAAGTVTPTSLLHQAPPFGCPGWMDRYGRSGLQRFRGAVVVAEGLALSLAHTQDIYRKGGNGGRSARAVVSSNGGVVAHPFQRDVALCLVRTALDCGMGLPPSSILHLRSRQASQAATPSRGIQHGVVWWAECMLENKNRRQRIVLLGRYLAAFNLAICWGGWGNRFMQANISRQESPRSRGRDASNGVPWGPRLQCTPAVTAKSSLGPPTQRPRISQSVLLSGALVEH